MLSESGDNSHLVLLLRAQGWVGGRDNLPKAGGLGVAVVVHGWPVDGNN